MPVTDEFGPNQVDAPVRPSPIADGLFARMPIPAGTAVSDSEAGW